MPRWIKGDPNLTWERYVEIVSGQAWEPNHEEFVALRDGFEISDEVYSLLMGMWEND